MLALIIVGIVVLTLVSGNLLATAVGGVGLAILYFDFNGNFSVIANALWNLFTNDAFVAIPTFILLGEILGESGLARRVYTGISPFFEPLPGRLLQTNIGASAVFSAISGSSTATSAVLGSIAYEELVRRGYRRSDVVGSIAGGGTLGILIPPSLAMIVYGAWQEVSIGRLFVGGILPGLMIAGLFSIYIALAARARPDRIPSADERFVLRRALVTSLQAWPLVILVAAILGTIFAGLATPTEAAALGVATALVLAVLYRQFTFAGLWRALRASALVFSTIALVMVAAVILSQAVALTGLPQRLLALVSDGTLPPIAVLVCVYAVYIVLGCFVGPVEMLLITLPFTFPLVTGLGHDPVWFGIAVVILMEIGLLTPPLGTNLFVVMAITKGRLSLAETARACIPYWLALLVALAIITAVPEIALVLPDLLF